MLRKNAPKGFLNLIRRVERIDKEAAKILKAELKKYNKDRALNTSFLPIILITKQLSSCFIFSETPQGHKYWYDIACKLGEYQ